MTPNEFIIWFKGFISAANGYNITPKQWDDIKDQINKVEVIDKWTRYTLDKTNWNVSATSEARNNPINKIDTLETKTLLND